MVGTGRCIATLFVILVASTIEGADSPRMPIEELLELAQSVPEHYDLAEVATNCSHYIDENKVGLDERLTLFRLRGAVRLKYRNAFAALTDFQFCQEAVPEDPSIKWLTARALATTGKFDEATTICEELKVSNPQFAPAFATSAVLRLKEGKTEESIAQLTHAISLDPSLQYAYYIRASVLLKKREFKNAINDCARALHLPSDQFMTSTVEILLRRGQIRLFQGAWKYAAADFSRVIQISPDNQEAHYGYWKSNFAQHNYNIATKSALTLLELSPDSQRSLKVGSQTFAKTGQPHRALAMATRWVQLAPNNIDAKVQKAVALDAAGSDVQALAMLDAILKSSPSSKGAMAHKCWMLIASEQSELRDPKAALQLAQQLSETGNSSLFTAGLLAGAAAAKLNDMNLAQDWFKIARDNVKNSSQAESLKAIVDAINARRPVQIAQPPLELL